MARKAGPKRIKVSDLVIQTLVDAGVNTVFGVTGGAVVHLFDSVNQNPDISAVFTNHEQAASFAVGSFAKLNGFGACVVTTGPGGTNAITGLAAAWLDSVPCIFISGQARSNQTIRGTKVRQVGTQEVDIISVVSPLTKFAITCYEIEKVKYYIDKAIFIAKSGRPGPVWLDIPVDLTWSSTEMTALDNFHPSEFAEVASEYTKDSFKKLFANLSKSKRPLVMLGRGCSAQGISERVIQFCEFYSIPFCLTWGLADAEDLNHQLNVGRVGLSGQRGANLAVQNCDFLLALGTHLCSSIVSTRPEWFARDADIFIVNVDKDELDTTPLKNAFLINTDVHHFISQIDTELACRPSADWLDLIVKYKELNFVGQTYACSSEPVNSYYFTQTLSVSAPGNSIFVVDGGGTVVYSSLQSLQVKESQKIILSSGLCSMGSGIPEAIGASYAKPNSEVYCFVGDGSLPFNVQEVATIKENNLPIKILVFNNQGYVSIRSTQRDFLEGREYGSSPETGLSLMSARAVSACFGLEFIEVRTNGDVESHLSSIVKKKGPLMIEIFMDPNQKIIPSQRFEKQNDGTFSPCPLEDMSPQLDINYLRSLMRVMPPKGL